MAAAAPAAEGADLSAAPVADASSNVAFGEEEGFGSAGAERDGLPGGAETLAESEEDEEDVFEVEKILDMKTEGVRAGGSRGGGRERCSWAAVQPGPCTGHREAAGGCGRLQKGSCWGAGTHGAAPPAPFLALRSCSSAPTELPLSPVSAPRALQNWPSVLSACVSCTSQLPWSSLSFSREILRCPPREAPSLRHPCY